MFLHGRTLSVPGSEGLAEEGDVGVEHPLLISPSLSLSSGDSAPKLRVDVTLWWAQPHGHPFAARHPLIWSGSPHQNEPCGAFLILRHKDAPVEQQGKGGWKEAGKVPVQGRTCPLWATFDEAAGEAEEGAGALQHTSLARGSGKPPGTGWPEPAVGKGLQGQVLLGFVLHSPLPLDLQTLGQTRPKLVSHWGLARDGFDPNDPTGNAVLFWPY